MRSSDATSDVRYRLDCIDRVAHKGIDYAPHTAACFVPIEIGFALLIDHKAIAEYTKRHHLKINTMAALGLVHAALGIKGGDDE